MNSGRVHDCFEHFLQFPPELRMAVIDEMEPGDRCRFTRCSKLCQKEAKSSKHYIYELKFYGDAQVLMIEVVYEKYSSIYQRLGYSLEFTKDLQTKYMKYRKSGHEELWRKKLIDSTNLVQYAIDYFKKLFNEFQSKIKSLHIYENELDVDNNAFNLRVENLNYLKEIELCGNVDIWQFFAKLRRPLDTLFLFGQASSKHLSDCSLVYQVRNEIVTRGLRLSKEQLKQLVAKKITIHIGSLTEHDIFHLIQSWQNGTIGKDVKAYKWILENSNFDIAEFAELLNVNDYDYEKESFCLTIRDDVGKIGRISCDMYELKFFVF